MRPLLVLVWVLGLGCSQRRLPADCKAHQAAVCQECGADSYACDDIQASMRLGMRHRAATAAVCKDGLERHWRNLELAGGVEAWCRMANDKRNFGNAPR